MYKVKFPLNNLFFVLFCILSCNKIDLNFNKFNNYTATPEFAVPLFNTQLDMSKIITNNSNYLSTDTGGLVHFLFRKDSIIKYEINEFININNSITKTFQNTIGNIFINDINNSKTLYLEDLSKDFSFTNKNIFTNLYGKTAIFPAINENINAQYNLPTFNNFVNLTFSSGWLKLKMTNKLPVQINRITIRLFNNNLISIFGDFNFYNIAPGGVGYDSINIKNKTLTNVVYYSIPNLITNASTTNTLINNRDSILLNFQGYNLQASKGTAMYPTQSFSSSNDEINISTEDSVQDITELILTNAKLKIKIQSNIISPVKVKLNFPGALLPDGISPYPDQYITIRNTGLNNTYTDSSINLAGIIFILDQNQQFPFDRIPYKYTCILDSNNGYITFDSSNFVQLTLGITNFNFNYVEGDFAFTKFPPKDNHFSIDALKNLSSGITLNNATLTMEVENSIGLPIQFNYNVNGISKTGSQFSANLDTFRIGYPPTYETGYPTPGEITPFVKTSKLYSDKLGNGRINGLLSLPSVDAEVKGYVNLYPIPKHAHILKGEKILINSIIDVPLNLKAYNLQIIDTVDFDLSSIKNATEITFGLNLENRFPFSADANIYFLDATFKIIDSISIKNAVFSAITDNNGRVIQSTKSKKNIVFSESKLANIINNNAKKIKIVSTILTENNGTKLINIFSDYNLKVSFGIITKIKL